MWLRPLGWLGQHLVKGKRKQCSSVITITRGLLMAGNSIFFCPDHYLAARYRWELQFRPSAMSRLASNYSFKADPTLRFCGDGCGGVFSGQAFGHPRVGAPILAVGFRQDPSTLILSPEHGDLGMTNFGGGVFVGRADGCCIV